MAQEVVLKFRGDNAQLLASLNELKAAQTAAIAQITSQSRAEATAAASLQRQRSAALISEWKRETREAEREQRQQAQAAIALQRQRSAALIAQWKADAAQQVRIQQEAERQIQAAAQRRSAFLSGAAGGVAALLGVSAISEIRQAGAAMLDYASKLETTKIAFTQMLGSSQAAEAHLKELQQFALKTPFQFAELIDASQRMQALGFNAQQVVPLLTDVGNAVAAAGGGSYRLELVVKALADVQSKGKLASQEIRQFAESGISAYRILETQLGKTRAELVKMVEKGEISSQVFIDAFQKFSKQNFGGLMEAQSKTFTGAMSNIKDALLQTSAVAFAPLYQKLSETAQAIGNLAINSQKFKDDMAKVGTALSTVWDGAVEGIHVLYDAYRVAMAAILGQTGLVTHGFFALAAAGNAVQFSLLAVARAAYGDFAGAATAIRQSQSYAMVATAELNKSIESEGLLLRTLSNVYRDASARANDFAAAQRNAIFKAAPNVMEGAAQVFGKPKGTPTTANEAVASGAKKAKGPDPAIAEQRLAELNLRLALANIAEEDRAHERSLKARAINFEQYAAEVTLSESKRHAIVLGGLEKERLAALQIRNEKQKEIQLREIEIKFVEETNKHKAVENKLEDERAARLKVVTEFLADQNEAIREEAQGKKSAITLAAELIKAYEDEGLALDANTKRRIEDNAQLLRSIDIRHQLMEALDKQAALESVGAAQKGVDEDVISQAAGEAANAATVAEAQAADAAAEAMARQGEAMRILKEIGMDTFSSLAQGIGGLIQNWVLLGSAGPNATRKMVASILAAAAAQAAVEAIMELAYAAKEFAMASASAAVFDVAGAALHTAAAHGHLVAAAIFGTVGAAAAIGGRLIAENAFQQTSSGGGGSSAGGSSKSNQSSEKPKSQDTNRRNYDTPIVNVTVVGQATEGFRYMVEKVAVDSVRLNGPFRRIQNGEDV